jgi:hypothetical protein
MKIQTRLARFVCFIAIPAVLAGAALDAFPQGAVKEAVPVKDARPAITYDIEISDGVLTWNGAKRKDNANRVPATIKNVVDLLREQYPDANFVMSPAVGDYSLTELKLRSSSVVGALEALSVASESFLRWRVMAPPSALDPATGLPKSPAAPTGENGQILYVLEVERNSAPKQANLQVEAFNISNYLGGGSDEDQERRMAQIEKMVHETVDQYSEIVRQALNNRTKAMSAPSIRFHRGANLVIIIGEPEGVAVAAKVIGALPGARRSAASDTSEPMQQLENRIKQLQRDGNPSVRR